MKCTCETKTCPKCEAEQKRLDEKSLRLMESVRAIEPIPSGRIMLSILEDALTENFRGVSAKGTDKGGTETVTYDFADGTKIIWSRS